MSFTVFGLGLVVVSSVCWSFFDLLRKSLVVHLSPLPLIILVTACQVPLFAAWWLLDPKPGAGLAYWTPALGSLVLNIGANLAFAHAVAVAPLSVTIPLLSFIPVLTTILAIPLLGELPSGLQVVGILLVVLGAFSLNLEQLPGRFGALLAGFRHRGAALMLVVASLWAVSLPLDKLAIQAGGAAFHGLVLTTGVALAVLLLLAARGELGELRRVRRAPWRLLAAVVVSTLALALQMVAMQEVWVSLVETLKRGIGNVLALVLGSIFFRETVGWSKVASVALMAAGVALVLLLG